MHILLILFFAPIVLVLGFTLVNIFFIIITIPGFWRGLAWTIGLLLLLCVAVMIPPIPLKPF